MVIGAKAVPGVPPIVGDAMQQLPTLIGAAESIENATGAQKSAAVMGFVQALSGDVGGDLTGGASDTFKTVQPTIQAAINEAVAIANAKQAAANPTQAPPGGSAT